MHGQSPRDENALESRSRNENALKEIGEFEKLEFTVQHIPGKRRLFKLSAAARCMEGLRKVVYCSSFSSGCTTTLS